MESFDPNEQSHRYLEDLASRLESEDEDVQRAAQSEYDQLGESQRIVLSVIEHQRHPEVSRPRIMGKIRSTAGELLNKVRLR